MTLNYLKTAVCCIALIGAGAVGPVSSLYGQTAPERVQEPGSTATLPMLSFADRLSGALPSVVRIVALDRGAEGQDQVVSSGSGAVTDAARGLIVTNAHVVRSGTRYRVEFIDGTSAEGTVVGKDDLTDIAVLRVRKAGLRQIELADSGQLRTGDVAFAVGYPLGLDQTVTMGIVSGLGRSGLSRDTLEDFIQTDAAINSGNSGGPLLDSRGRMIGVNTAILSPTGGNIGIGFAVPTRIVNVIVDQIVRNGEVRRGVIGVTIALPTREAGPERAATIQDVAPGSAAAAAGIRPGDQVIGVDGQPIRSGAALRTAIGLLELGRSARLTIVRNGTQRDIVVTTRPSTSVADAGAGDGRSQDQRLGARFRDLQPGDGLPQGAAGAVVADVLDGSPAERAGLLPRDVVVGVNGERVANAAALSAMLGRIQGPVRLIVARGNSLLPIRIR